ncbi:MAG TPA: phage Gp37/Gp68 family protein [Candidatus Binataceae bacterium]|nr:phage Gp37/Gp68 family protein [Candidatus Binataceae bacterium]
MSDKTGIQWTDATWNPVSGCSKVSPGCKNCYAERDWNRLSKNPKSPYFGRDFTDVKLHPERLAQPLRWRKRPRRIFVNSMSDLFHEDVPNNFIADVFWFMEGVAPMHTYQILTKRPERMRELLTKWSELTEWNAEPNVHLGVSVETREQYGRISELHHTPAAVKFLSLEPLLEAVPDLPLMDYPSRIEWVIVGGESGPNARPCNINWIRQIVAQCRAAGVPVFVKQLGAVPCQFDEGGPRNQIPRIFRNRLDRAGADPAEWPEDLRIREFPR